MVGAVDIGGTKVAVGIVDPEGKLLSRFESATQADGPYESALDRTATMLRAAMASTGANLQGIGIGSTGPVYPFTGEIGDVNFFPHWRGQNPAKDLEKIFGVPVAMENDADAAALGEAGWGSGRNKSRLIYVTVGTGIGAGIILEGHVYRGVDQAHPEIGHHVIDASGPLCSCGFRGCWESLAAGPAMVSWLESNTPLNYPHRAELTAKRLFELARDGDDWAQRAVEREAHSPGLGLASLEELKKLRDLAARLQKGKFKTVVLTGMGSSFHALHPLHLGLTNHGLTAIMVETSELVHYKSRLFDPKTLIVAVSQSGQSAEVVRLLEINRGKSSVIAITNTPGSPLAAQSNAAIVTRAGTEFSVSCKTYVTALVALQWLGDLLCGRDLRQTREELRSSCPAVRDYLSGWKDHVLSLAVPVSNMRDFFLVGRGSSLAAVGTGALIIKESDHFHAEGMSSAAFRHGPFEMLSDETFVLVFAGDSKTGDLNRRLVEDIR